MLRRQRQIRTQVHVVMDAGLFALGYWLAHWLRAQFPNELVPGLPAIDPFDYYLRLYLVIIPFAPVLLEGQGYYKRLFSVSRGDAAWQVGRACAFGVIGLILVLFLLRIQLARSVIILSGAVTFGLIMVKEQLLRWWMGSELGQAQSKRRFLVVGTAEDAARLQKELLEKLGNDIEVPATLNLNETPVERLADLLHEHSANGVILSARHTFFGQIEKAIQLCELEGVEVWLLADFFNTQLSQTSVDDFYGRPTLVFRSVPEASWQILAKQILDLAGAGFLLLLLTFVIPVIPLAALAIKLTSPGPALFRQQRSGLNGRPFVMLKFRSMVTDAEQRQHELAALNEMAGPVFKVTNDPRITTIGRWLRRYSIDELPQLWNVLRGEMSLVGPRPLPVDEVRRFHDLAHRRRLSVKPGLTCLWQISGRNEVKDFKDWVRLDLEYIDHWSLWLDLSILLRTIPAVFRGTGAK